MGKLRVEPDIFDEASNRIFNEHTTFENPLDASFGRYTDTVVGPEGHRVTLAFLSDKWRRLVNVQILPNNITPAQDRSVTTHVAIYRQLQFLVYVNGRGLIVGAHSPPRQPRRARSQSPTSSQGSNSSP